MSDKPTGVQNRTQIRKTLLAAVCAFIAGLNVNGKTPPNPVRYGDFEGPDVCVTRTENQNAWGLFIHGKSDARFELAEGQGREGSRGARYSRTTAGSDNTHLDQIIAVESNTTYEVSAWLRADGKLNPVLSVMAMNWRTLAAVPSSAGTNWTHVTFIFNSSDNSRVRFEWFPGAQGKLYDSFAGTSWLDDVSVTRLERVPPALQRALDLTRSRRNEERDVGGKISNIIKTSDPLGRDGSPSRPPIQSEAEGRTPRGGVPTITCRNGVLLYPDGSEVALWGVNLQTALSWEYNGRLKKCGVPLEAEALKQVADRNLDELVRMRASVIRMHLVPSDFTDAEGNLCDSMFLDVLDYTIAGCHARGIYVYLTLMNEMGAAYLKDSFMAGRDRREWITDKALADKSARYIRALLERENRYTKVPYKTESALAVFEIANEPGYVDYVELGAEPMFAPLRRTFEAWCAAKGYTGNFDLHYRVFRYDLVRAYVNRMCAVIRDTGSAKPVAWNLNWPRMVEQHEDVFQAVAESTVDAVSFCLYPGQHDVQQPYWQYPADLSGKNYLPFLDKSYNSYEQLRWVLGKRFAGKAKLVYEYETFFNQASYLYPAMARLFRALGVQIASMWTYSLTPAAEYMSGSHHLNLYCTPQKAASFMIAGELFARTPRYAPFEAPGTDNRIFDPCAVSFTSNASLLQTSDIYMQSRASAWTPNIPILKASHIMAIGRSPQVTYEGTGIYTVEIGKDAVEIEINPDSEFVLPPWNSKHRGYPEKVCTLDSAVPHRFVLHHPDWQTGVRVMRIENGQNTPVQTDRSGPAFNAQPGHYRIERNK